MTKPIFSMQKNEDEFILTMSDDNIIWPSHQNFFANAPQIARNRTL